MKNFKNYSRIKLRRFMEESFLLVWVIVEMPIVQMTDIVSSLA